MKYFFLLPIVVFGAFVLWMNLTPGHFRRSEEHCGCDVVYAQGEDKWFCVADRQSSCYGQDKLTMLWLSNLDFNK